MLESPSNPRSNLSPEGWRRVGPKGEDPNPQEVRVRRVGVRRVRVGASSGGSERFGPRRVGSPKFRAFLSLSRHNILSFFSLLGVLSWKFGGVFEAPGRLWGRRGFTRQPESPNVHT